MKNSSFTALFVQKQSLCARRSIWLVFRRPLQVLPPSASGLNHKGVKFHTAWPEDNATSATQHAGTGLYLKQLPPWLHRSLASGPNKAALSEGGGGGASTHISNTNMKHFLKYAVPPLTYRLLAIDCYILQNPTTPSTVCYSLVCGLLGDSTATLTDRETTGGQNGHLLWQWRLAVAPAIAAGGADVEARCCCCCCCFCCWWISQLALIFEKKIHFKGSVNPNFLEVFFTDHFTSITATNLHPTQFRCFNM
jgi:hypothetical protein